MSEDPDADIQNTWVPGSTFKGITAAIGVDSGKLDPAANMGYVGLSWQKDESWGDYHVTTLTDYGENAASYQTDDASQTAAFPAALHCFNDVNIVCCNDSIIGIPQNPF